MNEDQNTSRLSILLDILRFLAEDSALPCDIRKRLALKTAEQIEDILNHLA